MRESTRKEKGAVSRTKHTEAQMIGALKQMEAGRKAEDVAREAGVSKHTLYAWKSKYGGIDVSQAQEVKQLRDSSQRSVVAPGFASQKDLDDLHYLPELLSSTELPQAPRFHGTADLTLSFPRKPWAGGRSIPRRTQ